MNIAVGFDDVFKKRKLNTSFLMLQSSPCYALISASIMVFSSKLSFSAAIAGVCGDPAREEIRNLEKVVVIIILLWPQKFRPIKPGYQPIAQ